MGEGKGKGSNGPRKYNCINNWGGDPLLPMSQTKFSSIIKTEEVQNGLKSGEEIL